MIDIRSVLENLRDFGHVLTQSHRPDNQHVSWLVKKIEIDVKEKLNSANDLAQPENVVLIDRLSRIISSIDVSDISSINSGLKRLKSFKSAVKKTDSSEKDWMLSYVPTLENELKSDKKFINRNYADLHWITKSVGLASSALFTSALHNHIHGPFSNVMMAAVGKKIVDIQLAKASRKKEEKGIAVDFKNASKTAQYERLHGINPTAQPDPYELLSDSQQDNLRNVFNLQSRSSNFSRNQQTQNDLISRLSDIINQQNPVRRRQNPLSNLANINLNTNLTPAQQTAARRNRNPLQDLSMTNLTTGTSAIRQQSLPNLTNPLQNLNGIDLSRFAKGGFVKGPGTETSDSIPSLLSKNEYVVSAKGVKGIGRTVLDIINSGSVNFTKESKNPDKETSSEKFSSNLIFGIAIKSLLEVDSFMLKELKGIRLALTGKKEDKKEKSFFEKLSENFKSLKSPLETISSFFSLDSVKNGFKLLGSGIGNIMKIALGVLASPAMLGILAAGVIGYGIWNFLDPETKKLVEDKLSEWKEAAKKKLEDVKNKVDAGINPSMALPGQVSPTEIQREHDKKNEGKGGVVPFVKPLSKDEVSSIYSDVLPNVSKLGKQDDKGTFAQRMLPHAMKAASELGVDPTVLVAQAALETRYGQSALTKKSNNLFNIKASKGWMGETVGTSTAEYTNGIKKMEQADFRKYSSPEESFSDYVNFLKKNKRYTQALKSTGSSEQYLSELQKAGYATDPNYANKILATRNKMFGSSIVKAEKPKLDLSKPFASVDLKAYDKEQEALKKVNFVQEEKKPKLDLNQTFAHVDLKAYDAEQERLRKEKESKIVPVSQPKKLLDLNKPFASVDLKAYDKEQEAKSKTLKGNTGKEFNDIVIQKTREDIHKSREVKIPNIPAPIVNVQQPKSAANDNTRPLMLHDSNSSIINALSDMMKVNFV